MTSTTASARVESSFTTGVLFVHSCPKALVPHVEWALAREIGRVVKLDWSPQPLMPHTMRASIEWRGAAGTACAVASSLFGWQQLRFEVTEDQSSASNGGRWMHTPALGICHLQTDTAGNSVLTEQAIHRAIEQGGGEAAAIAQQLRAALGEAWDHELEPFRVAEDGDATIFALPRLYAG